eukprot:CAMPEP_0168357482 /NCGR_PEP_ID=MMETSP0228-20121227/612_1 /TAXON_ID=133427 /ORGANISM="Protoceratium reticulatum, Strain CCCM 535 (=CCMP 1889)" /LENGTH=168 /DNA_ID=CAMNT_0008370007 /DNA_START=155 /DNA_END=658 /DNA_ORIENTATION=+
MSPAARLSLTALTASPVQTAFKAHWDLAAAEEDWPPADDAWAGRIWSVPVLHGLPLMAWPVLLAELGMPQQFPARESTGHLKGNRELPDPSFPWGRPACCFKRLAPPGSGAAPPGSLRTPFGRGGPLSLASAAPPALCRRSAPPRQAAEDLRRRAPPRRSAGSAPTAP